MVKDEFKMGVVIRKDIFMGITSVAALLRNDTHIDVVIAREAALTFESLIVAI